MRLTICAAILLSGIPLIAHAQQQAPVAVPVGVVKAEKKPIAKTLDFVGRVEAINRVEVRARVTGYLEEVQFDEGDMVEEGEPLYRIEHGLYQAAVEQAQGSLERSKASRALTAIQLQRAEDLLQKQAGTVVARDQAKAADDQAKGAIMQDEASLTTAQINLGYTDIASPITGKASKTNVTKGNVVGPDSGVLTTIVSQNPMYVTFPVSQREFLRAQEAAGPKPKFGQIKARLRFADGRLYDHEGHINFVDVTVNRTTDTVLVRATFPNPDQILVDGQFANVTVELGTPQEKVVVPQAALIADQGGVYLFVVEDGKAVRKDVKPSGQSGTGVVLESGLAGGEQVIIEGLQGVRPGAAVRATPIQPALNQG